MINKFIIKILILFINIYKYFLSPFLVNKCRYLPTCSEYFIDSLKTHGLLTGLLFGLKRIGRCHPFKLFGGSSGLDFVPKKKVNKNG